MTTHLDMPLVAYRGWHLSKDHEETYYLSGMYRPSMWMTGTTVSSCTDCGEESPKADCRCGLHAYCQMPPGWAGTDWKKRIRHERTFFYLPNNAWGAALLWGPMHIGTRSGTIRARYGAILALLDTGEEVYKAAKRYRIPVVENEKVLRSYALEYGQEIPVPKTKAP